MTSARYQSQPPLIPGCAFLVPDMALVDAGESPGAARPYSVTGGATIGAVRRLTRNSSRTQFHAVMFLLTLMSLLAAACDEEASPTAPAPDPFPPTSPPSPSPSPRPVRAEDVVDRETLKVFVEAAAAEAVSKIAAAEDAYAFFDAHFRPEGRWRFGEVYLGALHLDGVQFFHAVAPEIE